MPKILVLASETIGGKALLDAVRSKAEAGDAEFYVVVPQTRPRHGMVIYDEAVRDSAQVRVDLALAFMRAEGIDGTGEVGDSDPLLAMEDALHDFAADGIIIATLPEGESNWLERRLIERARARFEVPVVHVVSRYGLALAA